MRKQGKAASLSLGAPSGRALSLLVALVMALGLVFGFAGNATAKTKDGKTVLAFTGDVHNGTDNAMANRVGVWIDKANANYNQIDVMGFCGDMGSQLAGESEYWLYTQEVMNVAEGRLGAANVLYTTGNYEFSNGKYKSTTNELKSKFLVNQEGKQGSNYQIYCLGTSEWKDSAMGSYTSYLQDTYSQDQVDKLTTYLSNADSSKPIIVMTHYPLHSYSIEMTYEEMLQIIPEEYRQYIDLISTYMSPEQVEGYVRSYLDSYIHRQTTNADLVIDALNNAVSSGKTVVLVWAHNHTLSDPSYDQVINPGANLKYNTAGSTKRINFYYASAGNMSDTEYDDGNAIQGKGLVITITSGNKPTLSFSYRRADGTDIKDEPSGDDPSHTHSLTKVEARAATCTVPGYRECYICTTCGKFFSDAEGINELDSESVVIPVTSHTLTKTPAKAATCKEGGNIEYWTCSVCGKYFSDAEGKNEITKGSWVTPIAGHTLNSIAAKDATCTTTGNIAYWSCSVCGKYFSDAAGTTEIPQDSWVIPTTSHKLTKTAAKAATCTAAGNSEYWTCSSCGKYFSDSAGRKEITQGSWNIPATGHDWQVKWKWSDDYSSATASFTCKNDASHTDSRTTSNIVSNPYDGGVKYTATVTGPDNKSYTDIADVPDKPIDVESIELAKSLSMVEGDKKTLEATVKPDDATDKTITWSSSNKSVATVDDFGNVTAVKAGEATITATATNGVKATCKLTVTAKVRWQRLAGDKNSGRYGTMAEIVKAGFASSEVAVLANGQNYPDALVASSVAGALDCPVVLTDPKTLTKQAKEQLKSLGVSKVYVMGGPGAVSDTVLATLDGLDISFERIFGSNRQETSLDALRWLKQQEAYDGTIVVATGGGFADALAIGPWCYAKKVPIILTDAKGNLSKDQVSALQDAKKAYIVGGPSAVTTNTEKTLIGIVGKNNCKRIYGQGRYDTAKEIVDFELEEGMTIEHMAVATGQNFPDALAGAALCGYNNSVLVLALNQDSPAVKAVASKIPSEVELGYLLGGELVVSKDLASYLDSLTK